MTRIKCCGLTRIEDVQLAARLGADAVGFVMTRKSRRFVDPAAAARLRDAVPPFMTTVALVMDEDPGFIEEVLRVLRPDMLQFHGAESDAECAAYGVRYLKAIAMGEGAGALARLRDYPRATGLLLDGHGLGEQGGSGRRFDWSLMPTDLAQPLLLAGGLTADNVGEAIRIARPWAVDVSSGIESSPGIKDRDKMERFISAVRAVPSV
ncbi:phosphoribosylanthranilate isomerase [Luteibacter yeojuensis]|uniref:N-(5'-phosphoribosyl)anthranilate isomerase n=1 Tax=Luteibacter yeojuensis TaxID=345309 RepID=A0A7X5QRR3_9GAMM|nr:phosphoribosylanthranilate isomerase [Luteibacter yeojuensis]